MKHILLTIPSGSNAGLTSASIGLVRALDRNGVNAGFYKPFDQAYNQDSADRSSAYLKEVTMLDPPVSMALKTLEERLHKENMDQILADVVETVEQLLEKHDALVIEGLIPTLELAVAEKINVGLANSLNAEVIVVKRPKSNCPKETKIALDRSIANLPDGLKQNRPGIILNKVSQPVDAEINLLTFPDVLELFRKEFATKAYDLIGVIPETPELQYPRVSDVARELKAEIVHDGNFEKKRISSICFCARHVDNIIHRLTNGTLLVSPADRSDVLIAAALAVSKGVELAGIVLTSPAQPREDIIDFCSIAPNTSSGLPILKINADTYEAANLFANLDTEIAIDDHQRIDLVMTTIARFIDAKWLRDRISSDIKKRLSPVAFKHYLAGKARKANSIILLPEGEEERTIKAALDCSSRFIARCVLMGNEDIIKGRIRGFGHECPDNLVIIDPSVVKGKYINALYERRKHKGMTLEIAERDLDDNILLGTVMIAEGDADGLVAGAIHSTANTVRPALQIIKPAPGNQIVSSIFFMCLPDQVYIYGDCAVNPDPSAEQLAEIAIQSANSAKAFGIEPKVAMISYSTLGSGSGSDVEKVQLATNIVKEREPDLLIDGPLQYDAATTKSVADKKAPDSLVAGQANVLIFPDLNTGNTTYKAVQRSANVDSIGPMLQGLNKPVNDLSRGATVEDIIYTITVTSVQAGAE